MEKKAFTQKKNLPPQAEAPIAPPLLAWYHQNRRVLPFREDPTAYHVWVSEIMLQQTQMATALPYYHRFMQALPDVAALAACDEEKLLKLWEGLGYYSRARNLQKAARVVIAEHGGRLPASYSALKSLPGIGEYTAGAIASIAFGLPEVAVDGNVLRVFSRLYAVEEDITKPATKKALAERVRRQQPKDAPGDYNQALMELGALCCLPQNPKCGQCPLVALCEGRRRGLERTLPVKAAAKAKKTQPVCLLLVWRGGELLLQKRPEKGLLAGLWQPLLFEEKLDRQAAEARLEALLPGGRITGALPGGRHVFTHRLWQMEAWRCTVPKGSPAPAGCVFVRPEMLEGEYALAGAFKAWRPFMQGDG